MLVVGLTGGIGCGKSTVAERLKDKGVPVIDADEISRELTAPASPILTRIADTFGREILDAAGGLDRRRLRGLIFQDPDARRRLEALLHPEVARVIRRQVKALSAKGIPYCVVVIPLLIESGMENLVDRILVVDCTTAQQLERVSRRDGCRAEDVKAIMINQAQPEQRRAKADEVIQNRGSISDLCGQIDARHRHYLRLAKEGGNVDGSL